jgi:lipid II:glycine glycyltransferase (peptidoglycan interpeptide bridge formation enzyme)
VNASIEKNQGKVYVAFGEGVALSAIFVVNDLASSYYLLGGSDYSIKNINANAVLLWHAAKDALDSGRDFDFEGSMNEGIEHFFRSFGAKQTPYFRISKLSSRPSDELKGNIRILYRDVKKIAKSLLKFSRGK